MFGYFTDLEICLVSEKILRQNFYWSLILEILVFQVTVSGSAGWGGQGWVDVCGIVFGQHWGGGGGEGAVTR